jgi:hypothetical protein
MPTIRIDALTTFPLEKDWQSSKTVWENFPYIADIDLVKNTYAGQPMNEVQIGLIKNFIYNEQSVLNFDDDALYTKIRDRTRESLKSHKVIVSDEHTALLTRMAMVMSNLEYKHFPVVLTARPGLGKTQMLKASLIEKIKANGDENDYSAIVVTKRVQDAKDIVKDINKELETNSCWVRPSFAYETLGGDMCKNGHSKKDYHPTICRTENCQQSDCRVKSWRKEFKKHPVVFITSEYLQQLIDNDSLKELMEIEKLGLDEINPGMHYLYDPYNEAQDGYLTYYRSELIIDENPGMVFSPIISSRMLNDCMAHIKQNEFPTELITEYKILMMSVAGEMGGGSQYEYTGLDEGVTKFSKAFKRAWENNPHSDHYDMPLVLNTFVENGGIRQNGNRVIDYAIGTSQYRKMKELPFRTVILDGSGLKDSTYKNGEFYILDIPDIRDYSRALIHVYSKNLSKAFYYNDKSKKMSKINAVAEEAIRVLEGEPSLFITYMGLEKDFKELFKEHQNISVNHFGNLIGSNIYRDCTAVFFAGINDWGTFNYFMHVSEITGKELDLSTVQQRANRFTDPDVGEFYHTLLAVGIYQDLMRSNLRVVSGTESVDIYLWTEAKEVVHQITEWLPQVNEPIVEPVPSSLIGERQPKDITTENKQKLDKYISTLTDEDFEQGPKYKSIGLTKALADTPSPAEYEYVWGPIKHGHYSRIKDHSEKWLEPKKDL